MRPPLSDFKIIRNSDYLKTRIEKSGAQLAKAVGSARQKALIDFLIERRNKLNLTQAQVAARLGEYQSFVARLESGERRVDVVEFLELAEILEFDPVQVVATLKEI